MTIGTKIKKIRELKGLKQSWVAEQLFISQAYYSKIESHHDIKYSDLMKIARVLDVKVEQIINFEIKIL